jgi:Flp pilus assembly protein TadG
MSQLCECGRPPAAGLLHRTALRPRQRDPGEAERGALTLMLAVLFPILFALMGLVIDGGAEVTSAENATSIAQEAARAGAGIVNQATAYANGSFVVDDSQAVVAANQYLATAGYPPTAAAGAVPNTIEVSVTITQPTRILSIIGIDSTTVTGHATARLRSGVTGPGQ